MAEPGPRRRPGPLVRVLGRAVNPAVAVGQVGLGTYYLARRVQLGQRLEAIDYRSVPQIPSDPLRLRSRSGSPAILSGH